MRIAAVMLGAVALLLVGVAIGWFARGDIEAHRAPAAVVPAPVYLTRPPPAVIEPAIPGDDPSQPGVAPDDSAGAVGH